MTESPQPDPAAFDTLEGTGFLVSGPASKGNMTSRRPTGT